VARFRPARMAARLEPALLIAHVRNNSMPAAREEDRERAQEEDHKQVSEASFRWIRLFQGCMAIHQHFEDHEGDRTGDGNSRDGE
jgi:hypothetical protein